MTGPSKFDELNTLAQRVFASLCEGDSRVAQFQLSHIIKLLLTKPFHKFNFHKIFNKSSASNLQPYFEKIAQILSIECERNSSDGKEQLMVKTSLGKTILKLLLTDDNSDTGHNVTSECKAWIKPKKNTKETGKCTHSNELIGSNMHIFRCDYHQHDSLMTHLVLACLINGQYALKLEKDDHFVFLSMFTGLVHDCGKILTRQLYEFKDRTFTGFPAHGEVGGMVFLCHYSQAMNKIISWSEYHAIYNVITNHMCGYHGPNTGGSLMKREFMRSHSPLVKDLLTVMRFGDHCASLPSDENIENYEEFVAQQDDFVKEIGGEYDHSAFLKKYDFVSNKLVLYLIGTSGAGKSYFSEQLGTKYGLDDTVAVIGRDECIAEAVTGTYKRVSGQPYKLIYNVYNAKKELATFCKKNGDKKQTRNIIQQKAKLEKTLSEAVESLDTVSISDEENEFDDIVARVNDLFCNRIKNALDNPTVKLVVIDTMMSLFPSAIQWSLKQVSELLRRHFIIHVHVHNYKERTDGDNIGGDISAQLQVSGPFGPTQPLHPGGSTKSIDLKSFSSVFTDRKDKELTISGDTDKIIVPEALHESAFRPYNVTTVMQTPDGNFGYNEVLEKVGEYVSR